MNFVVLCKMALVNVIEFVVLKILHNLFSYKYFCLQITADAKKITKNVQDNGTFISTELRENVNFSDGDKKMSFI